MSRIFSTFSGSGETLKASSRQGFRAEGAPDLRDGLAADPVLFHEAPCRPVRCVGRRGLQGVDDDRFDDVVPDAAYGPGTGGVDEPVETLGGEAMAPLSNGHRVHAEVGGDLAISLPIGTAEDDPAAKRRNNRPRSVAAPSLGESCVPRG